MLPDLDHLGFTVDRPNLPKGRRKGQGDTPRATGQVEQTFLAPDASSCEEVLQESCGIGDAISGIVGGRASKGIDVPELFEVGLQRPGKCFQIALDNR